MAYDRKDIALSPEWPWIMFGDGYQAQVPSIIPGKDIEGNDVYKMVIIPSKELAKKYNITIDMLDQNLSLNIELPMEVVHLLCSDPSHTMYFSFLNVIGQTTPGTEFWKGKQDADKLIQLRKLWELERSKTAFLTEKLSLAESNISEYIKEHLANPAKEMSAQLIASQMQQQQMPGVTRTE